MAKKKGQARQGIRMKSTESDYIYHTEVNKKNNPERMELKKFDPTLNRHVPFKEQK
jgi:large subunit ribosomal protein L33